MKVGLEIHQQLAPRKLHCRCPGELTETVQGAVERRLRAAHGEEQGVDPAAEFQAARELVYRYEWGPSNCLVDLDEEPPVELDPDALDVALTMALLLHARPVDEIQVMRKIVVDGSNTSGFQRTSLIAVGGYVEVEGRRITVQSICLEEDAARKVAEKDGVVTYRLDRLGIPLIEISTEPEMSSGEEARRVAEEIGALLRATDRVRRGIGTIREDLNVSIDGGRRVEIKGAQELRLLPEYVEREAERQRMLLTVREALRGRGATAPDGPPVDLTGALTGVAGGPVGQALRRQGVVLGLRLPGFAGLLRSPPGTTERLGRELADQARACGLHGLLHSDELPNAEIGEECVRRLRELLGAGSPDAFVLVAGTDRRPLLRALEAVAQRAAAALEGVPGETRDPLPDGRSRYSRPIPGRFRMYPETDVPPMGLDPERIDRLRAALPERPSVRRDRLIREHRLPAEVAGQLVVGGQAGLLEALVARGRSAPLVARLLTQDLPAVNGSGEGGLDLTPDQMDELLRACEAGRFAKEGLPQILEVLKGQGAERDVPRAIATAGFTGLSREELDRLAEALVDRSADLVRRRGAAAFSPLMGDLMREVRGRRDGQEIAEALRKALRERTGEAPTP
ncbi:MAG: Glu-tRNA(Gln) amidotransferase subunit GatE [Thermoplasmata archaeon]